LHGAADFFVRQRTHKVRMEDVSLMMKEKSDDADITLLCLDHVGRRHFPALNFVLASPIAAARLASEIINP
jgi:hypothetical protein